MDVIHKKTNTQYFVDDVVINATNDIEPEESAMILYHDQKGEKFVRKADEFFEKFDIEDDFNLLSKACELAINKSINFYNKQCVEQAPKPKIKTYVRVDDFYNEDGSISHSKPEGVLDKQEMDELIRKHTRSSCSCDNCSCESNGNNDFIPKRIDLEVYESYKQIKSIKEEIPIWVIKQEAMEILRDLFTIRCNKFEVEEKQYDNSTNEFFLIGRKEYSDCCSTQVVQISKDLYHKIIIEYHGWVNQIVGEEEDDDQFFDN